MENVIVTGANGFIGKTLVNALLAKGCRVTALDVRFDDVLADDPRVTCITGQTPPMSHSAINNAASDFIRRSAAITAASSDAAATSATVLSISAAR